MANNVIRKGFKLWIEDKKGKRISNVYRNLKIACVEETKNLLYISKKTFIGFTKYYVINKNTGKILFKDFSDSDVLYSSYSIIIILYDYAFIALCIETGRADKYEVYDCNGNLLHKHNENVNQYFRFYKYQREVHENKNLLRLYNYIDEFGYQEENVYDLLFEDKIIKKNIYDELVLPDNSRIIITNNESISMYDLNTMECLKEKKFNHNSSEYKSNEITYFDNIIIVSFYDSDNYRFLNDEVLYADTFENVLDQNIPFYRADFEFDYLVPHFLHSVYLNDIIKITLYDDDVFENVLGKRIYNYKLKKYISDVIYEEADILLSKYILLKKCGRTTLYTIDGKYIFSVECEKMKLLKSNKHFIVYSKDKQSLPGIIKLNGDVVTKPINLYRITEFRYIKLLAKDI